MKMIYEKYFIHRQLRIFPICLTVYGWHVKESCFSFETNQSSRRAHTLVHTQLNGPEFAAQSRIFQLSTSNAQRFCCRDGWTNVMWFEQRKIQINRSFLAEFNVNDFSRLQQLVRDHNRLVSANKEYQFPAEAIQSRSRCGQYRWIYACHSPTKIRCETIQGRLFFSYSLLVILRGLFVSRNRSRIDMTIYGQIPVSYLHICCIHILGMTL